MLGQLGLGELVQENVDILATVTDMSDNLSFTSDPGFIFVFFQHQ